MNKKVIGIIAAIIAGIAAVIFGWLKRPKVTVKEGCPYHIKFVDLETGIRYDLSEVTKEEFSYNKAGNEIIVKGDLFKILPGSYECSPVTRRTKIVEKVPELFFEEKNGLQVFGLKDPETGQVLIEGLDYIGEFKYGLAKIGIYDNTEWFYGLVDVHGIVILATTYKDIVIVSKKIVRVCNFYDEWRHIYV